jgi:hypothetical protein
VDSPLASRPCRERDLVMAMIARRILNPCPKLAATRAWNLATLAGERDVEDANELHAAMDWLHPG